MKTFFLTHSLAGQLGTSCHKSMQGNHFLKDELNAGSAKQM